MAKGLVLPAIVLLSLVLDAQDRDQGTGQDSGQDSGQDRGARGDRGDRGRGTGGRSGRLAFKPNRQIVRGADADADGAITSSEWSAFCDSFEVGADGQIDPVAVRTRALVPMLDQDKDAQLTIDDLFLLFESIDKDGDYEISAAEFPGGRRTTRPAVNPVSGSSSNLAMASVALRPADLDGDKTISTDEWGLFIDAVELGPDGTLATELLVQWMDAEQLIDTGNTFEPGAILRWVENELDANQDDLVTVADLQIFFDALDKDGDGELPLREMVFSMSNFRQGGDRSKPALMPWQRNLEDALALCEATGKPLLICVNMDEEFASESLAWSRYRDPAFVELAKGFVTLIVSPDRHNPRDRDDRGRRIVDEKFGRVTNAEHIDIEQMLFERYFDNRRVSPRHIAIDGEGNILFDIFLENDLTLVDAALREHGKPGPDPTDPALMSEKELLASPDALHRERIEAAFLAGDERTRARLASLALSSVRAVQHSELLLLALSDPSENVRVQGVWSIVRHPSQAAAISLELFVSAYQVCHSSDAAGLTDALLDSLQQVAATRGTSTAATARRARRLYAAMRGMGSASEVVLLEPWRVALSWATPAGEGRPESSDELFRRRGEIEERLARAFEDPEVNLAFAAATMQHAKLEIREGRDPSFLLEDVIAAADRVLRAEPDSGRALAQRAWARFMLSDVTGASDDAAAALPRLIPWAGSPLAADTLELLADTRTRGIYAAIERDESWPVEWTADVRAAYEVLLEHPRGSATHALSFVGFLNALEIAGPQVDILRRALRRFPHSGELHAQMRRQLLRDAGAAELEQVYAELDLGAGQAPTIAWYDGLAQLRAAERRVQNDDPGGALAAYQRSVERFQRAGEVDDGHGDSAGHYLCLASAGIARIHLEKEEWPLAIAALRDGVPASPESVWRKDGLGNTPRETADKLYKSLKDSGRAAEASAFLAFLDENGLKLEG